MRNNNTKFMRTRGLKMVYYGTYNTEGIVVHLEGDADDKHIIFLTKECNEATFTVSVCCYDDWEWKFSLTSPANYEMVKHMIMDAAFECEDMDELIRVLDEIFEEGFSKIVINEDECEERCCENCNHRDCLN
jgi:hypothetical protein